MALNKFIPNSPDENIKTDSDMATAKFGHLNTIVDYVNENSGGGLGLKDDAVFSGGTKIIVDKNNTSSNLAIGTGDNIKIQRPSADSSLYGGYVRTYFFNDGGGENLVNGAIIGSMEWWARYNNSFSRAQFKLDVVYNGNGSTRRGKALMGVAESSGYGAYQFMMTQFDKQKICVIGHGASVYIDDAVDPLVSYNMHAANIINTGNGSLAPLAIDNNGILLHKFYSNGNVTFGEKTDQGDRIYIKGAGSNSSTNALKVANSLGQELFTVKNDGSQVWGVVPTASSDTAVTHKIPVEIDGSIYYIHLSLT